MLTKLLILLEHRAGIEPANTGFADQRVSHFATGAHARPAGTGREKNYSGCAAVRRYGFTVL
jgi:hypothetical protein